MTENSFTDRIKTFDENYKRILEQISASAEKSGRRCEDIKLLAATKTVPAEIINHAIDSGISCVGENRVQEFMDKYESLNRENTDFHFIGRLQTNKVKYIIGKISTVESLDSIKLAKEISRISERENVVTEVLVEVNIGSEENKGGIIPEKLFDFIDEARLFPSIHVNGLMAIPPVSEDSGKLSAYFNRMKQYYIDIEAKKLDNVNMNVLSMGMSDDFQIAIEHGSNMIRLGSALFGRRN